MLKGKNPPEDITDKERLKESNTLMPEIYRMVKINKVKIKYIILILIDCLSVSLVLKFIKFVRDFFKLLSKISISKIIEIKKYKPPNHCVVERHSIKLSFKCLRFSKIVNPVDVKPETASK